MERGAWRVTVHGVAESNTNEKLSTETKKAIFSSPDPQIVTNEKLSTETKKAIFSSPDPQIVYI